MAKKRTTTGTTRMSQQQMLTQQMMMGGMMGSMMGGGMNPMGMGMRGTPQMPMQPPQEQRAFYAAIDGRQAGPFTVTEISQLIGQSKIVRETLVWKQGMASWQQAQTTPEIMVLFGQAPAQSAAPSQSMPPPPPSPNMPPPPKQTWEHYSLPIDGILNECSISQEDHTEETQAQAAVIKEILAEFKIEAEVTGIIRGPVVTMYEILPAPGIKLSKITELENNIALRLAAKSLRILSPIPGKNAVGIEVPNKKRDLVSFRKTIESCIDRQHDEPTEKALPVYLGKTITGEILTVDLATMPHLLVAGTTGSGKSVCINSIILSLLYQLSPSQCRMIFIDPKIVELSFYDGIPHLLTPVITDPEKTLAALSHCVTEMERRYEILGKATARNIKSYNKNAAEKGLAPMPYWVVIIDEFADLMAVSGKETEAVIARLAAKSRAVGIHLILATQRPSTNVITGIIKSNIPARIAFMVASNNDSRIILDSSGAEKLLGKGDMLYSSNDAPFPIRAQGAYVCEGEAEKAAAHLRSLGKPEYVNI